MLLLGQGSHGRASRVVLSDFPHIFLLSACFLYKKGCGSPQLLHPVQSSYYFFCGIPYAGHVSPQLMHLVSVWVSAA